MDKVQSVTAAVAWLEAANCAHCSRSFARRIADPRATICPPCRRQMRALSEAIARNSFIAHLLDFDNLTITTEVNP